MQLLPGGQRLIGTRIYRLSDGQRMCGLLQAQRTVADILATWLRAGDAGGVLQLQVRFWGPGPVPRLGAQIAQAQALQVNGHPPRSRSLQVASPARGSSAWQGWRSSKRSSIVSGQEPGSLQQAQIRYAFLEKKGWGPGPGAAHRKESFTNHILRYLANLAANLQSPSTEAFAVADLEGTLT